MKPDLSKIRKVYFLGIGGIGMSALARYFRSKGIIIHGYDRTSTGLTDELIKEGMVIHFTDDPSQIPADMDLVIYTPAIPRSLNEFQVLSNSGIVMLKRSQVTGEITKGKITVAVAGTHGKTSISSLIAHILRQADYPVTALTGGICNNYGSNFITSGKEEIMVVEADEYDRSFLWLNPDIAIISAMDADHLDIYGSPYDMIRSFGEFAGNIKSSGRLIMRAGLQIKTHPGTTRISYAAEEPADWSAMNLRIESGIQVFDMSAGGETTKNIKIRVPGRHNVENALAAAAACSQLGMDKARIIRGIESFTGVLRRFDIRVREENVVYIDDYAHHPVELEAFITAVRQLFPGKRLTGMFQPHLYTRTRDFAEGFARSLDLLDEVWLMDIYPAREEPIPGVTSELILEKIHQPVKKLVSRVEALSLLRNNKPQVFLTIGAGDIDQLVGPITKILSE